MQFILLARMPSALLAGLFSSYTSNTIKKILQPNNQRTIMKLSASLAGISLILFSNGVLAQWNNWGMPGFNNSSMMPSMPYSSRSYSQPYYAPAPQNQFYNMMPFASQPAAPAYNPRPAYNTQPFAGMMPFASPQPAPVYNQPASQPFSQMMPWARQPQPQYQAPPAQQPFMMPGMEQGIRSMMQPGKVMMEEATPGMHLQPTWR